RHCAHPPLPSFPTRRSSDLELAWRLRNPSDPAPWLAVTGTNGKTTAVRMLGEMLRAAGHHAAVAGNVGAPLVAAVLEPAHDVVADRKSTRLNSSHVKISYAV